MEFNITWLFCLQHSDNIFSIPRLESTGSSDLINAMIPFIEKLKNSNTRIVTCCTNNCGSIKAATSNTGKETISQVAHLSILRIPCEIHSTLPFIADIKKRFTKRAEYIFYFSSKFNMSITWLNYQAGYQENNNRKSTNSRGN